MAQKFRYDEKTNSYIPVDDVGNDINIDNNDNTNNNNEFRREDIPPRPSKSIAEDDKLIGILIWAGQFVAPLIISIIAYVYYENKNDYLRNIGKEALNFNISAIIYGIIIAIFGGITMGIGFIAIPLVSIYGIVIPIIGMIKASEMEIYVPHVTIRFLK